MRIPSAASSEGIEGAGATDISIVVSVKRFLPSMQGKAMADEMWESRLSAIIKEAEEAGVDDETLQDWISDAKMAHDKSK